jgi:hypothetical protein
MPLVLCDDSKMTEKHVKVTYLYLISTPYSLAHDERGRKCSSHDDAKEKKSYL